MKTAIVTGVNGQDGSYLSKLLVEEGYRVIGTVRSLNCNLQRLNYLNILPKIELIECNFLEMGAVSSLFDKFKDTKIDEFYNLAALSFVHSSFITPHVTFQTNAQAVLSILEHIKKSNKETKFYQASTSEIYGNSQDKLIDEKSYKNPASPYGIAKLTAYHLVRMYREAYGLFCCNGILFNHESPLRGDMFVTKKITKSLARYIKGLPRETRIGNIYSKRDWGYAGDFVDAMHKILQQRIADDYVVSTNETYSIKEFIEKCLVYLGIEYKWVGDNDKEMKCIDTKNNIIFETHKDYYRPLDVQYLKGNYAKAKKVLKWEPKTKLDKLIEKMIEYDLVHELKYS